LAQEDSLGLDDQYRYYDRPVNPDDYLIRPGEVLVVTFLNTKLAGLRLTVNPEGRLVDRGLGVFDLGGQSLSQAREILRGALSRQFQADDIDISVDKPYKITVAVTGAVRNPGLYQVYTSQYVSEALALAGGALPEASSRRISIEGPLGSFPVDLDRATIMGDNSMNPAVYVGERIEVPFRSDSTVSVLGQVLQPRQVELLPGDSLDLLLALAGGLTADADRANVKVLGAESVSSASPVAPGAVILVPPLKDSWRLTRVQIFGAVKAPGRYRIDANPTLGDLLASAGGAVAHANLRRLAVFRLPRADELGVRTFQRYPLMAARGEELDRSFALEASDSVFVPSSLGLVYVEGAVVSPGPVPFVAGQKALDYVMTCGGFSEEADRSAIIVSDRVTGTSNLSPLDVRVLDGDRLVVRNKIEER
jgi:protein involved in polysaccharide export with SLBB domain